jgi:hypothetical protein
LKFSGALIALCLTVMSLINFRVMATEEPEFTLISQENAIEVREYKPKIIARVEVEGDFDDASSKGFKLLADYIFGNNLLNGESQKISMTAPVEMTPLAEDIVMTSAIMKGEANHKWQVNFVMPKEYKLDSLPRPNNEQVKIIEIPKEKYAVIVFSGLVRDSSYTEKAQLLNDFIMTNNMTQLEAIKIARYNPPWTLPFFRRNELMAKIK